MKVLIAMRNKTYADYLSFKLTDKGNQVQIMDNGVSALKAMKEEHWDLVLIGILLEYYSGLEVIAEYRKYCDSLPPEEKEKYANVRIVIITRVRSEQAHKSARMLGVSDYFELPLNTSAFMSKILAVCLVLLSFIAPLKAQEWKCGIQNIGANYYIEHVSEPSKLNWQLLSAEASIGLGKDKNHFRTLLNPRINFGQRTGGGLSFFDQTAFQAQLDAYLIFSQKMNLVGSYAYSASGRFPSHLASLELNHALKGGWGITEGVKVTNWNHTAVAFLIGAEKYVGPFWLTLKPMVVVQSGEAFLAARGGIRYYYSDATDNYFHLGLFYGNSPEYANYLPDLQYLLSLGSWGSYLSWQQKLNVHFLFRLGISYRSEEYRDKEWRNVFGANAGLTYKF